MAEPMRKNDRIHTYTDYKSWPEGERWELIDGVAWNMSPAANRQHQELSTELVFRIRRFLEGYSCSVYHAPFDVVLLDYPGQPEDEARTVVQPDISVICDRSKLTEAGCTGAPNWVIEILSPYTARKDISRKFELYQRHGVREYWVVDPGNRFLHVYVLGDDGRYPDEPVVYTKSDVVRGHALQGFELLLSEVFARVHQ